MPGRRARTAAKPSERQAETSIAHRKKKEEKSFQEIKGTGDDDDATRTSDLKMQEKPDDAMRCNGGMEM